MEDKVQGARGQKAIVLAASSIRVFPNTQNNNSLRRTSDALSKSIDGTLILFCRLIEIVQHQEC